MPPEITTKKPDKNTTVLTGCPIFIVKPIPIIKTPAGIINSDKIIFFSRLFIYKFYQISKKLTTNRLKF